MGNFLLHLKIFLRNITVEPLMFMYMTAIFISYPAFQALLYRKICVQNFNESFCDALRNVSNSEGDLNHTYQTEEDLVQTETSHWILINNVVSTIPSCISVLCFLGPLVDKVNHKMAILLTLSLSILLAVSNLIGSLFLHIPVAYLLIGSIINGLGGGFVAMMMAIYSYITIISSYRNKTFHISIVESMIFLAGFLGVFISGLMVDKLGFIFTYSFIIGLLFLSVLYVLIRLPSSIPNAQTENKFQENDKFCKRVCKNLSSMLKFVRKEREESYKLYIGLMIFVILILQFATSGENDVMILYVMRAPLSWSTTLYGYFKGTENFLRGAMLLTVLPVLKYKFQLRDTSIIIIGMMSKFVGFIFYSCRITEVIFTGAFMSMLMGFPSAGLRSSVSSLVDKSEHGHLFGLIASLESISSLIATLMFNEVYPASLLFFPGLCFILAAIMVFIGGCIVWWLHVNMTTNTSNYGNLELSNSTVNSESEDGVGVVN